MAKTKFTRNGVEIRRSGRKYNLRNTKESPPAPRRSPRSKTIIDGAKVSPPKKSKKRKRDCSPETVDLDREELGLQIVRNEDVDDDDHLDREELGLQIVRNEDVDDDDGLDAIVEETCRDIADLFGEDARNDDCEIDEDIGDEYAWDEDKIPDPGSSDEENEEELRPAEVYREDIDPEELLQLGKTFSDAEDFKHACLRYTFKTRRNIKYYRSSGLKMGVMCAAKMREDEAPCPWKIYCSYEKKKQKLQIKTYVNNHTCEVNGESKILKRSPIANLFSERLRLNPKITTKEIQAEILREYQMTAKENSCIKAKTKVMKERRKTLEQHFDRIWDYQAEVFKSNPGSTFEIETIR